MDLDLILEPNLSPDAIAELGLLAESLNFRGIWAQNYASARDAFMSLVPLAKASKRIRVGVVIVCPYEMHPMKIVNATLSLNEYADGRGMVVIGSGGEWPEVMRSKVFHSSYRNRRTHIKEALEISHQAITRKKISYEGTAYSALRFSTEWHKEARPLIYHGACGPKMIATGAGLADGVMMSDVMPAMFATRLPALRMAKEAAGNSARESPGEAFQQSAHSSEKQHDDFRISNFIAWHVREDRERSYAEARRELIVRGWLEKDWLKPYLERNEAEAILNNRWPFLKAWIEGHGNIEGVPPHITAKLVEELSLAGDLNDLNRHIERLLKFRAAGFTEIALRVHEDPADSIKLIGNRVLPALS
jgi:alkanesulfonate monooxygenase SsuD/methylene tetrahydromethanopterin reductase-like flavin-dependent oxidoreductase (luciferase family)